MLGDGKGPQGLVGYLGVVPFQEMLLICLPPVPSLPPFLQFLLDPCADEDILALPHSVRDRVVPLLLAAVRTVIWPVHRERLRALGLSHFLM